MSLAAEHESKRARRDCESCRQRKAGFQYRGVVRADRDHTLCFECYRSERDRRRARLLADSPARSLGRSPFLRFSERQLAHRRAMLEFSVTRCRNVSAETLR
jgi:hypothetical protein